VVVDASNTEIIRGALICRIYQNYVLYAPEIAAPTEGPGRRAYAVWQERASWQRGPGCICGRNPAFPERRVQEPYFSADVP